METKANPIPGGEKALAELCAIFQVLHRTLPDIDFIGRGRLEQPARQFFLASASSKSAEQLEDRSPAKEIEIPRIRMRFIDELRAGFSGSCPAIFKPGEAAFIESDDEIDPADSDEHKIMQDCQDDKNHNDSQQSSKTVAFMNEADEEEYSESAETEFGVSEDRVPPALPGAIRAALFYVLRVDCVGGIDIGCSFMLLTCRGFHDTRQCSEETAARHLLLRRSVSLAAWKQERLSTPMGAGSGRGAESAGKRP